jgi:hypothetical protein
LQVGSRKSAEIRGFTHPQLNSVGNLSIEQLRRVSHYEQPNQ